MINVGIDLGTNNCCITYIDISGYPHIIKNKISNEFIIPSIVYINNNIKLVGQIANNYDNKIYNFKRLIGHNINDNEIIELQKQLTYKIEQIDDQIMVITDAGSISLIEIISTLLDWIKHMIEEEIKEEWECIVTIPAYFNEIQRKLTLNAIHMSNLPCVKLINEPTSACMAYLFQNNLINNIVETIDTTILVFDFGAGTLDLTILRLDKQEELICHVCGIYGDNNLGGIDITNVISKHLNINLTDAENIKLLLSNNNNTHDLLTYNDFVSLLNINFKDRIYNAIKEVLLCSKLDTVDEIIMVGGSSKLPWVKLVVNDYFEKTFLKTQNSDISINNEVFCFEDVAVSLGAALHGNFINTNKDIILVDRIPLSIGIDTLGIMTTIIPRNSIIPISITKQFTTEEDNQSSILIKILQGESRLSRENIEIGCYEMSNIKLCPKNVPVIYVTIKINSNAIVEVFSKERRGDAFGHLQITNIKDNLTNDQIVLMIEKAEKTRSRDIAIQKLIESYHKLVNILQLLKFHMTLDSITDGIK